MFLISVMSFVVGLMVAYTGQLDPSAWGDANLYTLWAFGVASFFGFTTALLGKKADRIFSAVLTVLSLAIASHYVDVAYQISLF